MPRRPDRVKLIAGLLFSETEIYLSAKKGLVKAFGKIDFESETLVFNHTSYYKGEMGEGLKRKFLSFESPANLEKIYAAKIKTNKLEARYMKNGSRRINIDPGYLNLSKLVLFSTKDFSHRIYLGNGIFGEITLLYKDKKFNALPWTYPDYRTPEYMKILDSIRQLYKGQTKAGQRYADN